MFKNYIKIAFRSLRKNRLFSTVNILGLALGITSAVFILQYSFFELSYDRFHSAHEDIYRVMNNRYEGDKLIQSGQITYSAVGKQMEDDYPEIIRHTTVNTTGETILRKGDKIIEAKNGFFVHQSFFEMFDFELIAGNTSNLVKDLFTVVLTESVARSLFEIRDNDFESVIGELIFLDQDETPTKVTGIIRNPPENSHLTFQVLASRNTLINFWPSAKFSWNNSDFFHYIQLVPGANFKDLEAKFEDFSNTYFKGDEVTGTFERFHLQPLDDVHLYSDYEYEFGVIGDGGMVWSLVTIAGFILLMAWINYINITTSRALERAKEVGIRKVVGAERSQLIRQFLMETIVVNLIALVLSFTFIQLLQSEFNNLVELDLSLFTFLGANYLGIPTAAIVGGMLIIGTFLSGIYPAFILSSYLPSQTLKGKFDKSTKGVLLRKGLVVFQFSIATLLIAGTLLVYKQVNYMRNQDLGLEMDHVMVINSPSLTSFDSTFVERIATFKNQLKRNPNIMEVGTSRNIFGERLPRAFNVRPEGSSQGYMINRIHADYGFMTTYNIEMLAGRDFLPTDHHADGNAVKNLILNKKASELFGFETPEDAINKRLSMWGRDWFIVGVTDDFHNRSLKQSIEPILFVPFYDTTNDYYNIKLSSQNIRETVSYVESTFNEFYPGNLFEFTFMDEEFNNQYRNDELFGKVFNLFSVLTILISCLGLFGLAGYTVLQRTKEIGIRKVLGASIQDVLKLISKDFVRLIAVASLLALPLVYLGAQEWLASYAFQIPIGVWLFLTPLAAVFLVALVTISFHIIKSANRNPVESLRYE